MAVKKDKEVSKEPKPITPFTFINSVSFKKDDMLKEDPTLEKEYNAYLTNMNFSNFPDTVIWANDLNRYPDLDKKLQYYYYFYGLSKRNRFAKWAKPTTDANIKLIQQVFECNVTRAQEILPFISPENLNKLEEMFVKV